MKKVIRLTESDLIRLVKRVIKENEAFPNRKDYDNDESFMDAYMNWFNNNDSEYETFDEEEELSSLIDQQEKLMSDFPKYNRNDYENEQDYMQSIWDWSERSGYDELEQKVSILRDKRNSINKRNKEKEQKLYDKVLDARFGVKKIR